MRPYERETNSREYVSRVIQNRANDRGIEFSLVERGQEWFVYGFDLSTCTKSAPQTTWILIQPPDTIYRSWHWNLCGDTRYPMKKEQELADLICRLFDRCGSLASCSLRTTEILNNEWGMHLE